MFAASNTRQLRTFFELHSESLRKSDAIRAAVQPSENGGSDVREVERPLDEQEFTRRCELERLADLRRGSGYVKRLFAVCWL